MIVLLNTIIDTFITFIYFRFSCLVKYIKLGRSNDRHVYVVATSVPTCEHIQ